MRDERRRAVEKLPKNDNVIYVTFEDDDAGHWFVTFERNGENMALDMGVCDFAGEMSYWSYPTEAAVRNGKSGFLVGKAAGRSDIEFEIERFVRQFFGTGCEGISFGEESLAR